jgi:regulator of ribonuclease activity A
MTATADILDEHGDRATVCAVAFRQFGGRRAFEGPVSTGPVARRIP